LRIHFRPGQLGLSGAGDGSINIGGTCQRYSGFHLAKGRIKDAGGSFAGAGNSLTGDEVPVGICHGKALSSV
jgi:hypothetical protein